MVASVGSNLTRYKEKFRGFGEACPSITNYNTSLRFEDEGEISVWIVPSYHLEICYLIQRNLTVNILLLLTNLYPLLLCPSIKLLESSGNKSILEKGKGVFLEHPMDLKRTPPLLLTSFPRPSWTILKEGNLDHIMLVDWVAMAFSNTHDEQRRDDFAM